MTTKGSGNKMVVDEQMDEKKAAMQSGSEEDDIIDAKPPKKKGALAGKKKKKKTIVSSDDDNSSMSESSSSDEGSDDGEREEVKGKKKGKKAGSSTSSRHCRDTADVVKQKKSIRDVKRKKKTTDMDSDDEKKRKRKRCDCKKDETKKKREPGEYIKFNRVVRERTGSIGKIDIVTGVAQIAGKIWTLGKLNNAKPNVASSSALLDQFIPIYKLVSEKIASKIYTTTSGAIDEKAIINISACIMLTAITEKVDIMDAKALEACFEKFCSNFTKNIEMCETVLITLKTAPKATLPKKTKQATPTDAPPPAEPTTAPPETTAPITATPTQAVTVPQK